MDVKEIIARRIAKEFKDGQIVNLGFGIPNLSANYKPDDVNVYLQAENGALGFGPNATKEQADPNLTNSASMPITLLKGASTFDMLTSFAIIRGGHVDMTVLGALEVAQNGDIANWLIPGVLSPGMGGAMDLLVGAKKVIVSLQHTDKKGNSKVLKECTLPLSAAEAADMIITDKAVFEVTEDGLVLKEHAPGVTLEEIEKITDADFTVCEGFKEMDLS